MRPLIIVLLTIVLLTIAVTATSRADTTCPMEPPVRQTVHYADSWSTDPYSDEYLMGNVQGAVCDGDGNFYFLDQQLQEVSKFSADGEYIDTIVRKGEGPGEISQVWRIEYWAPGQLILPQAFPARVVRVSPDGTPLDLLKVFRKETDDSPAAVGTLVPFGEQAIVTSNAFIFDQDGSRMEQWIGVIDREGTLHQELASKVNQLAGNPLEQVVDEKAEFWAWERWAVSPEGRLFRVPERDAYRIEEIDLEGNLVSTTFRDMPARARTDEEFEEMRNSRNFIFNGQKAKVEYKLFDTEPPIYSIHVINGQLWVRHNLTSKMLPDGVWARFSIHALDGELIEERDLALDFDPEEDLVNLMWDGAIFVVENGVAANAAAMAAFGVESGEDDEEGLDEELEPAFIRILRAE